MWTVEKSCLSTRVIGFANKFHHLRHLFICWLMRNLSHYYGIQNGLLLQECNLLFYLWAEEGVEQLEGQLSKSILNVPQDILGIRNGSPGN